MNCQNTIITDNCTIYVRHNSVRKTILSRILIEMYGHACLSNHSYKIHKFL